MLTFWDLCLQFISFADKEENQFHFILFLQEIAKSVRIGGGGDFLIRTTIKTS